MNKSEFIRTLMKILNINESECSKINDILESEFVIGKKNKYIIINKLVNELDYSNEKADNIYNTAMNIISSSIKDKLFHPFKGED